MTEEIAIYESTKSVIDTKFGECAEYNPELHTNYQMLTTVWGWYCKTPIRSNMTLTIIPRSDGCMVMDSVALETIDVSASEVKGAMREHMVANKVQGAQTSSGSIMYPLKSLHEFIRSFLNTLIKTHHKGVL